MPTKKKRLYLLDGHSLSYRAYYALPGSLATTSGQVTNAVYGFTSMLIKLLSEEHPDLIAVAFDKGPPVERLAMYADYKAGREAAPDDFREQLGLIREVLETLRIPIVEIDRHEADDVIATLALRAIDEGMEAVIVTADRDFFQLVRPGVRVLFNRKGISEIVSYDEAAVADRFGLPPEQYLDYVALKGDPSDNIPGIPGVGEKTASRLIQQYGSVEEVAAHAHELPARVASAVADATDDLVRNKEVARLRTDLDLPIRPGDCVPGDRDEDAVRRLFTSLEFRTLLERLEDAGTPRARPVVATDLDLHRAEAADLSELLSADAPVALALEVAGNDVVGVALAGGDGRGAYVPVAGDLPEGLRSWLADPDRPKAVHDAKELRADGLRLGLTIEGIAFDTLLAGYLLDPGQAAYPLEALCERHLGADPLGAAAQAAAETAAGAEDTEGQLPLQETWRAVAGAAAAVGLLEPVMRDAAATAGVLGLLEDVELPLAGVLASMQAAGVALDVDYLREMSDTVGDRMRTVEQEIYEAAGEEFNLNSPPQLRVVLYEKLGLQPGKRTKTGYSTDADTLEKLRDAHPVVDGLLRYREMAKLKSTYLDALPPLVRPDTGRVHTTFSQVAAATGRLSSVNPNLQNIPVRGDLGRQIRRAFVAGAPDRTLLVADYSQIELRVLAHLSGDGALAAAFATDTDVHAATAAKAYRLPVEQVDPEMRRFAKVVNYGLAYGMNAYGLAQRLGIPPDEAQAFIDAYFEGFPRIRAFLDRQVGQAAADGYTATILGRRRYLPELRSPNPRIRELGRRMALNAPIQGSAADIIKVAMIAVDRALGALPATMVLTVHDELVVEVNRARLDEVSDVVRKEMESAYELSVPLRVDVGSGDTWADAAPH